MTRLALLPAALLFSLGAASAAPSHLGPSLTPALSARAGVGGMGRPGRWLPVDVTISGTSRTQGVLRVEWGDAVMLRDVDMPVGEDQHVTVFLRAIAAAPIVHVVMTTLTSTQTLDTPIDVASLEDPFTLCVGDIAVGPCTARIAEASAPTTWRAFDLADFVIWPAASHAAQPDAARALATWRAMRWLGDDGPADPVLPPFDSRVHVIARMATGLSIFALVVTVLVAFTAWRRARLSFTTGIPAAAGLAAGLLMLNPGLSGHADGASMQVTGVVHQFDGTTQSTLSLKAEIEHPSTAPVLLQPALHDATLSTNGAGTIRSLSVADHNGRALYRDAAGAGTRRRLALDGTLDETWLSIVGDGVHRAVINRAPFTLADCIWRGANPTPIGTLPPGGRFRLDLNRAPANGDSIVCALPNDWLAWTTSAPPVAVRGRTYLVFHFWPAPFDGEPRGSR